MMEKAKAKPIRPAHHSSKNKANVNDGLPKILDPIAAMVLWTLGKRGKIEVKILSEESLATFHALEKEGFVEVGKGVVKLTKRGIKEIIEPMEKAWGDKKNQAKKGEEERQKNQTRQIIEYALESCEFFKDVHNRAYVAIKEGVIGVKGLVVYPLNGREFRQYIAKRLWEHEELAVGVTAINSAVNTLEAIAILDGETYDLKLRVARGNRAILYDTGGFDRRIIKITEEGWRFVEQEKPIFLRYPNMREIVEPVKEAKPEDCLKLLRHIRVTTKDQLPFICSVVTGLVPDIAHVVMVLYGTQGAGKTTACDMMRETLNPSSLNHLSISRDNSRLILNLLHNYIALFDNVDYLTREQSDILTRAVTGDTISQRELYSNDEELNYKYRRVIIINGINIASTKADFQDRAILFELERIPKKERKTEEDVWKAFREDLPAILGGIFATISGAMGVFNGVKAELAELPRMADFALWGEAVARTLGYPPMKFLNAYIKKIINQSKEVVEADMIGGLVVKLAEGGKKKNDQETLGDGHYAFSGTATELLEEIRYLADEGGLDIKDRSFPKSANALSRRLREIQQNLKDEGITVIFPETRENNKKIIKISKNKEADKLPVSEGRTQQEWVEKVYQTLKEIGRKKKDGNVMETDLEKDVKTGDIVKLEKILETLERDKKIMSPYIGQWRVV